MDSHKLANCFIEINNTSPTKKDGKNEYKKKKKNYELTNATKRKKRKTIIKNIINSYLKKTHVPRNVRNE